MARLILLREAARSPALRTATILGTIALIGLGGLQVWSSMVTSRTRAELDAQILPRCPPPVVLSDGTVPAVVSEVRKRLVSNEVILFEDWTPPRPVNIENVQGWLIRVRMILPDRPRCEGDRIAIYVNNMVKILVTPEEYEQYARERGVVLP